MGEERSRDKADADGHEPKKPRKGFRVGPDNLPDGPWKRKVDKVKKDLIHKAKVKKAYAKIKARELENPRLDPLDRYADRPASPKPQSEAKNPEDAAASSQDEAEEPSIHPQRQALLDNDDVDDDDDDTSHPAANRASTAPNNGAEPEQRDAQPRERKKKRPGYFDKPLQEASRRAAAAEQRAAEAQARRDEKERRLKERQRMRRLAAKARTPGANGQRKLGRESELLLEKVRKMMGQNQ